MSQTKTTYLLSQEDHEYLMQLIDREPGMCSQSERTVCMTILRNLKAFTTTLEPKYLGEPFHPSHP